MAALRVPIRRDGEGAASDGSNRQIHGHPRDPAARWVRAADLPRSAFGPAGAVNPADRGRGAISAPSEAHARCGRALNIRAPILVFPALEDVLEAASREPADPGLPINFATTLPSAGPITLAGMRLEPGTTARLRPFGQPSQSTVPRSRRGRDPRSTSG